MIVVEPLIEWIKQYIEDPLLADGWDKAIAGVVYRYGQWEPLVLYDRQKIIQLLIEDGLTEAEAEEHFEFNIIGAWVG